MGISSMYIASLATIYGRHCEELSGIFAEIPWQSPYCFQESIDYFSEYEIATEYA
jgi:hypothetical protein